MILKHEIRAADWDLLTLNTFKWYFGFWDDAGQELTRPQRSAAPPQLVIFLKHYLSRMRSRRQAGRAGCLE